MVGTNVGISDSNRVDPPFSLLGGLPSTDFTLLIDIPEDEEHVDKIPNLIDGETEATCRGFLSETQKIHIAVSVSDGELVFV